MKGRLLCTFVHRNDVKLVADLILRIFDIKGKSIYVYCNEQDINSCYLTYSAYLENQLYAKNTISIHRNVITNTLYTVNALNEIIMKCNNGKMDSNYILDWDLYENMLLLTGNDEVEKVRIKFMKRIQ